MRELINTTLDLQAKDDSALRCLPFQRYSRNPIPERVRLAVGVGWGGAPLEMPGCTWKVGMCASFVNQSPDEIVTSRASNPGVPVLSARKHVHTCVKGMFSDRSSHPVPIMPCSHPSSSMTCFTPKVVFRVWLAISFVPF